MASSPTSWTTRSKVLFLDPARRSEIAAERDARTSSSGSCGNLYPKQHCADLKLPEFRTKLNELNATLPPYSYAPVLHRERAPPKTYIHVKGDWREHGDEVHPGTLGRPAAAARRQPLTRLTLAHWLTLAG